MSSYSATIQLDNGTLTVARPYPAEERVDDLIDTLIYQVREGDSGITGIGITIATADTPPASTADAPAPGDGTASSSDTPVGDAAAKAAAKASGS